MYTCVLLQYILAASILELSFNTHEVGEKMAINIEVTVLPDGRLDTENAAAYLGLSVKTLAMLRSSGRGPSFVKRGRVFYFRDDLDQWLEAGKATSTAQARVG